MSLIMAWCSTKFVGVRYRESDTRRYKGKPDKCFYIRYKRSGKLESEPVGWLSEGVTPQVCSQLRSQIVHNIRHGEGFQSLKEKRKLWELKKEERKAKRDAEKKGKYPF